jgi:hypothetical protein
MATSVFERRYESTADEYGDTMRDYRYTADIDPRHVWSCMEGDNGKLYLAPGFHVVNMVGYVVTVRPWSDADLEDLVVAW